MPKRETSWPAPSSPGLRIGEAAHLLQITTKAIRVYHDRGLLPEPRRDESGYRRYDALTLVVLARIVRLRNAGFSLRSIRALLCAEDDGSTLCDALRDLDESLAEEIEQRKRRRSLIQALQAEGISDPLQASAADAAEQRAIVWW